MKIRYFNKLFDTSKFTSTSKQKDKNGQEADVFSLTDPEEEYKKLLKYEKSMEKLRNKDISENVLSWVQSLDAQTAQDTIDVLAHMTDAQLKNYSKGFDKYKSQAEKMADDKYSGQIKELEDKFISQVDEKLSELPGYAETTGVNTVQGYINGLKSNTGDLATAATSFVDTFIGTIKDKLGIHSPSKETEELGEYTAKGFLQQFVNVLKLFCQCAGGFFNLGQCRFYR